MSTPSEKRRASRIAVHLPTVVESIGQPALELHPSLARVYARVAPAKDGLGKKIAATVRDLSTNGAFLASEPLPLLSRVAFSIEVSGFGKADVLGWVLWRRDADCIVPGPGDRPVELPRGFGVLFESIPLDARLAIHRLVQGA